MSSPKDLRKRLEALNRGPLPEREQPDAGVDAVRRKMAKQREAGESAASARPQRILYRRDLPPPEPKPHPRRTFGPPVKLHEAVSGEEVTCPRGRRAFLIESDVRRLDDRAAELCKTFGAALSHRRTGARCWITAMCEIEDVTPDDVIFIDLETTGLAGSPLFLIGTMTWADGGLVVRQYFARNYAEEPATIALCLRDLAEKTLLVSFNGKTFDLPYVRVRAAANAIPYRIDAAHLDLLHVSRRIWRQRLPNCKLQTLERHVCGRTRSGDIPGEEIPQAYHNYVRTDDAREMVECLKHNMLDLVTLADLMTRLPPPR